MAETVGSLVDKISIIGLKIFHMEEQVNRKDASPAHVANCRKKLSVLRVQQNDLQEELTQLFRAVLAGEKTMKVYRQYKMYNDPIYRSKL